MYYDLVCVDEYTRTTALLTHGLRARHLRTCMHGCNNPSCTHIMQVLY